MKIRLNLNESFGRNVEWIMPSSSSSWKDISALSKTNAWLLNYFPNKESWSESFKNGVRQVINLNAIQGILNLDLDIKHYDPEVVYATEPAFQAGTKVPMPVVIHLLDQSLFLVNGGLRLALCRKFKVHPSLFIINAEV